MKILALGGEVCAAFCDQAKEFLAPHTRVGVFAASPLGASAAEQSAELAQKMLAALSEALEAAESADLADAADLAGADGTDGGTDGAANPDNVELPAAATAAEISHQNLKSLEFLPLNVANLASCSAILLQGANPFYLLAQLRAAGLHELLCGARSIDIIALGAASEALGPSLAASHTLTLSDERAGLGLLNFNLQIGEYYDAIVAKNAQIFAVLPEFRLLFLPRESAVCMSERFIRALGAGVIKLTAKSEQRYHSGDFIAPPAEGVFRE